MVFFIPLRFEGMAGPQQCWLSKESGQPDDLGWSSQGIDLKVVKFLRDLEREYFSLKEYDECDLIIMKLSFQLLFFYTK